jgi:hypothetical protein
LYNTLNNVRMTHVFDCITCLTVTEWHTCLITKYAQQCQNDTRVAYHNTLNSLSVLCNETRMSFWRCWAYYTIKHVCHSVTVERILVCDTCVILSLLSVLRYATRMSFWCCWACYTIKHVCHSVTVERTMVCNTCVILSLLSVLWYATRVSFWHCWAYFVMRHVCHSVTVKHVMQSNTCVILTLFKIRSTVTEWHTCLIV